MESRPRPIVVTHDAGQRFLARVRSHAVAVDQPVTGGGLDTAPMPIELLGVSLGTCIALYARQYCVSRHLPCEGMRVEVDQSSARNPSRVGQFTVRVIMPEPLPAPHDVMLERVVRSCPAHHTLMHETPVNVVVEMPVLI